MKFKNEIDQMNKDILNINKSFDVVKFVELIEILRDTEKKIAKLTAEKSILENIHLTPTVENDDERSGSAQVSKNNQKKE